MNILKVIKRRMNLIYIKMLHNLESYYITNNNIIQWTETCVKQRERVIHEEKKEVMLQIKNNEYKSIHQKDGLFWAFFYMCNGDFSYMTVHNTFSTEKLEKINYVETFRSEKQLCKKYKVKLNHIEDQLLNSTFIDISTFYMLCVLRNISIIIYNKYFYWSHICNENIFIIKYQDKKVSIYDQLNIQEEVEKIKKNKIEAVNLNRLIKSMSAYKMADLKIICDKLNINMYKENGKKKKKQDIYQEICIYI